jgi:hypothetical protein
MTHRQPELFMVLFSDMTRRAVNNSPALVAPHYTIYDINNNAMGAVGTA